MLNTMLIHVIWRLNMLSGRLSSKGGSQFKILYEVDQREEQAPKMAKEGKPHICKECKHRVIILCRGR